MANFVGAGKGVVLNRNLAIFVTHNPTSYGGSRNELPANVSTLFRPVAVMVPDYLIIVEVSLYAAGFIRAQEAAEQVGGSVLNTTKRSGLPLTSVSIAASRRFNGCLVQYLMPRSLCG